MRQSIKRLFVLTANYKLAFPSVTANFPKTIENLGDSISSELDGNPPLWVTKRQGSHGEEVYINNARLITERSNFQSKITVDGEVKTQVSIQFRQFLIN